MEVRFTRDPDGRDLVEVTRSDGSSASWSFPGYGDVLPHDLIHLVVEQELGLVGGFWGLVDGGADVVVESDQAVLVRDGRRLTDFGDLQRAEDEVARFGPRPALEQVGALVVARPDAGSFGADAASPLGARLRELAVRWRTADGPIVLTWDRC